MSGAPAKVPAHADLRTLDEITKRIHEHVSRLQALAEATDTMLDAIEPHIGATVTAMYADSVSNLGVLSRIAAESMIALRDEASALEILRFDVQSKPVQP